MYDKSIQYDRETCDYAMYLDGELFGFAKTYHDAEVTLDRMVFELMTDGHFNTTTELDGDPPIFDDPLPEPGPEGPSVPGDDRPYYIRDPRFDKRIGCGDDYAGDAWRDQLGLLRWVAVGYDPNALETA